MSDPEAPQLAGFASVYVELVRVRDFRGIDRCELELEPTLTLLVGRNNAGKSRILRAIGIALGGLAAELDDLTVSSSAAAEIDIVIAPAPPTSESAEDVFDLAVALRLERGIPVEALAPGETSHVSQDDIAVLARSAAALRSTRSVLEAEGYQAAMSSSPEDWLSTLPGKIAYEVVALMSAGSHRSTHWQLARLMEVEEDAVRSPADVAKVLRAHPDVTLQTLVPLCGVDTPTDFIASLAELEMPEHGSDQLLAAWEADRRQLVDAWRGFVQRTDQAEQTWGNFRIHVSRLQRGDDLHPGVRLLTIHKAQGREYRAVVVVGLNDGQMPDFRASTQDERIAELRTFYVAVTRPSRLLLVTRAESRQTRYGSRATEPSPYLRFLPDTN